MQFSYSQQSMKMRLPAESCQADTQDTQLKVGLGEEGEPGWARRYSIHQAELECQNPEPN